LDTRTKILDLNEAEDFLRTRLGAEPAVKVVVAYCDPMVASHVRRLKKIARNGRLIVLVSSPTHPILPVEARAELVAALDVVEKVIAVQPSKLRDLLRLVPGEFLVMEQAGDAERTDELVRHVHARQKA
jgi:glycerol-3-phosphate cytidylyltransferase-like family protein